MFCHLYPLLIFPLKLAEISTTLEELTRMSHLQISPENSTLIASPNSNLKDEEYFQQLKSRKPKIKRKFKNINELMEITQPIEMLLVDVENNDIDDDFMDDHDQVFDLTQKKALQCPDAMQWEATIQAEMYALNRNKTWTLVPHPQDRNVISCK